jgi:cobalt/nickel transport protein
MTHPSADTRNRIFVMSGLGVSLLIGVFLSPFASQNPTGLDQVSQDFKFDKKAAEAPPSHKLPFYQIFDEYALRGVPEQFATPIAGLVGTLATFGLAWGIGKLTTRGGSNPPDEASPLE